MIQDLNFNFFLNASLNSRSLTFDFVSCSELISPVITVETCGEKKYTASKDDVACNSAAAVQWREHLFFEPRQVVSDIIMSCLNILLTLYVLNFVKH